MPKGCSTLQRGVVTRREAFVCEAVRTPIGRYGGSLSTVRTDDLAAIPIRELLRRQPQFDASAIDDVILGCANQAGEDNRNVARMAGLLAGLPETVPGATVNRLCGSGLNAVAIAAQAIKTGEANAVVAGGVESMSRAPFVLPKATMAFARKAEVHDTTLGWRFINPKLKEIYGVDSMAQTAENVAQEYDVSRADQDAFAALSQSKAASAMNTGRLQPELCEVVVPRRRGPDDIVVADEHPRPESTIEVLSGLRPIVKPDGAVTAGNASGINDGACALLVASEDIASSNGIEPLARIVASASAGVPPRVMGIGPINATRKVLALAGLRMTDMSVIELNEAFAAQALACLRELGVPDEAEHVNPNGGAIALGHPLGMSGARLVTTAAYELRRRGGRYALCAMCIGVGQGIAMIIERADSV